MSTHISQILAVTAPTGEATAPQKAGDGEQGFQTFLSEATEKASRAPAQEDEPETSAEASGERSDHDESSTSPEVTPASESSDSSEDQQQETDVVQEDQVEISSAADSVLYAIAQEEISTEIDGSTQRVIDTTSTSEVSSSTETGAATGPHSNSVVNTQEFATNSLQTPEHAGEADDAFRIVTTAQVRASNDTAEEAVEVTRALSPDEVTAGEIEVAALEVTGGKLGKAQTAGENSDTALGEDSTEAEVILQDPSPSGNAHDSLGEEDQSGGDRPAESSDTQTQEIKSEAESILETTRSEAGKPNVATREIDQNASPESVQPVESLRASGMQTQTESGEAASSSPPETEPVPTQDRARFVQRVSRAFQSARANSGEIQLKLSPPELGSLRLSITVEQGIVSAKVETETAAARNVLLDNLPALRERLAEQEIRIEKFDVDVGRDSHQSNEQPNSSADERHTQSASNDSTSSNRDAATGDSKTAENKNHATHTTVSETSLDVSI